MSKQAAMEMPSFNKTVVLINVMHFVITEYMMQQKCFNIEADRKFTILHD
jgi:hypothetical protein